MPELPRTIGDAAARLRSREVSAVELADAFVAAAQADPCNAWLRIVPEHARRQAEAADARLRAGDAPILCGIPWACKDIIGTKGIETTAASKILAGYVPPYSATVVERLEQPGAVMLGKTNLDEFAMGSSNENSAFGPVRNPWDPSRVPGGSSGGSAAAVASGEAIFALGTDTGGSIRQPGALCGVVGMKPTYGRVSRYGVVAFASSLDQVGPLTTSVADAAIVCEALFGSDPHDATTMPLPAEDLRRDLEGGVKGLRLGVPREFFIEGMEPGVESAVRAAVREYERMGAQLVDVSLPSTDKGLAVYYIVQPSEASANLARYDGVRFGLRVQGRDLTDTYRRTRGAGFGPEVKRRMILGTYALSAGYHDAYYVKAQQVRTIIKREFDAVFETVDALLTPTAPTVAFALGAKTNDPLAMYLNDVFTLPVNIAGLPGMSIPCGLSDGLPVGLQIIANSFQERTMFRVAAAFEAATGHHLRRPAQKSVAA
ncbi:MAG TPA: Asp-tRNA(Asn)/Glu-tRNA(Gln) amidotransferase subunit GatA [Candidatus Limnocylindria bacterium]|nr:Asp-tRNA(Asn)/Glu-tRNA(Gln) amidotransferase subunit GatA [Candidatus Limnocylindria bacterium]